MCVCVCVYIYMCVCVACNFPAGDMASATKQLTFM